MTDGSDSHDAGTTGRLTVSRALDWDSMHRLPDHPSKCAAVHGHRYRAIITISAEDLNEEGMVVDFGSVKAKVGEWIAINWDHNALLWSKEDPALVQLISDIHRRSGQRPPYLFDSPPTAEAIAAHLAQRCTDLLIRPGEGLTLESVAVWETPNCYAQWQPS